MLDKTLLEMCQYGNYDTDKFLESKIGFTRTWYWNRHAYVDEVYTFQFERIREQATNVLEIGIDLGGSILLWRDYFPNAQITGIDIKSCDAILNQERITNIVRDAYTKEYVDTLPNNSFDLIIDDGPHTLETMCFFIENYISKLKDTGIMVIEDIADASWLESLIKCIPEDLHRYTRIYDLRAKYNRLDELFIVIDRGVLADGQSE
jgi:hypothetical protein